MNEGLIRSIARKSFQDPNNVDDIAQQVMLQLYKARNRIDFSATPKKLTHFVSTVTRNVCIDELRKKMHRLKGGKRILHFSDLGSEDERRLVELADPDSKPTHKNSSGYTPQEIRQALQKCTPKERQTVELFLEGLTYSQISERLDISPRAVRSRFFTTRQRLNRILRSKK